MYLEIAGSLCHSLIIEVKIVCFKGVGQSNQARSTYDHLVKVTPHINIHNRKSTSPPGMGAFSIWTPHQRLESQPTPPPPLHCT